jgi:hypothetical protein
MVNIAPECWEIFFNALVAIIKIAADKMDYQ